MRRRDAEALAFVLDGEAIETSPDDASGEWTVLFRRRDGRLVLLSDDCVDEFYDEDAYEEAQCYASIKLH